VDEMHRAAALEAILFTSGDPLAPEDICMALEWSENEFSEALQVLETRLSEESQGLQLRRVAGKLQMITKPEYADMIRTVLSPVKRKPLSQSALETLSIIAYKQPVTKAEIEAIRGVRCDYALEVLRSRGIVHEAGHRDSLGRPSLYATTEEFLKVFGLANLEQLPDWEAMQTLITEIPVPEQEDAETKEAEGSTGDTTVSSTSEV